MDERVGRLTTKRPLPDSIYPRAIYFLTKIANATPGTSQNDKSPSQYPLKSPPTISRNPTKKITLKSTNYPQQPQQTTLLQKSIE